jgi:hypothetical protein
VAGLAKGAKYAGWALGLPVSIALAPVVGLLALTPWVDLPLAVDIASAPALGLGYLAESVVGVPAYGVGVLLQDEPQAALAGEGELSLPQSRSVPWGFVVDHREAAPEARPAAPVGSATRARYAVSPGDVQALVARLDAAASAVCAGDPYQVPIDLGFPATVEVYPAEGAKGSRPLLFMTPPIRATFASRWLAERYAKLGVHCAILVPERTFLQPELDGARLEAKLRAAVISGRVALGALRARPDVDPERLFYMGISAGAIYGSVLMALEPVERAVLLFPGGDLPRIVTTSTEAIVVRYREGRERVGQPAEALRADLSAQIQTDPQRFARHVEPARVLVFLGAWDSKVPVETGLELCRAMGRPETWLLAGDHASAAMCFGFVLDRADAFLGLDG